MKAEWEGETAETREKERSFVGDGSGRGQVEHGASRNDGSSSPREKDDVVGQ